MLPHHASPRSFPKASSCCSLQTIMVPLLWFYLLLVPLSLLYLIHMATTVSNDSWVGAELGSSSRVATTTIHTTVHVRAASFSSSSITNEQRFVASSFSENSVADKTNAASATANPSASASSEEDSLFHSEEPSAPNATLTIETSADDTERLNLLLFSPDDCPASYPPTENTTYRPWKPMWIAGYPGSGNDLLRNLVEHLSGFPGKDVYTDDHCHLDPHHEKYDQAPKRRTSSSTQQSPQEQQQRAATCKTHYPAYKRYPPYQYTRQMTQDAAILLVRNPMNAMPSHFNFLWEYKHQVPDHSQQAPEQDWIKWRNAHWQEQLRHWQQVLYYWYEHWELLIVLPYEHLTQPTRGPALLQMLAAQLDDNHMPLNQNDTTPWLDFDTYDFGCHWHYCVQSKRGATVKRSGHAYQPTFTPEQYQALRQVLAETYYFFKVRGEQDMSYLLLEYLTTVHATAMQVKKATLINTTELANATTATR